MIKYTIWQLILETLILTIYSLLEDGKFNWLYKPMPLIIVVAALTLGSIVWGFIIKKKWAITLLPATFFVSTIAMAIISRACQGLL